METTKKIKDFDCVEMKNAIQAQIYAEIKDMTSTEILAYFNNPFIKKGANVCHPAIGAQHFPQTTGTGSERGVANT
jgi:hypothetical protein